MMIINNNEMSIYYTTENLVKQDFHIGLISTWNTKCGIANYSKYLVSHTPDESHIRYTIFARKDQLLTRKDEVNVIRCWQNHDNIQELLNTITNLNIQLVDIMFNYAFFTVSQLANLVIRLKARGVSVVITVHDAIVETNQKTQSWGDIVTELNIADVIIVFNEDQVRQLKGYGISTDVVNLPQGILSYPDEDRYIIRRLQGITNSKIIASTGFLLPDKGILEVINALPILLSSYPDLLYFVVSSLTLDSSSEKYYTECRDAVRDLKLDEHVRFNVDYLEENVVITLLHMADIILLPRKQTVQPTSAALRFALSALRPVITTDIEVFKDFGPEVYKINDSNPKLIVDAINKLYSDEILCNELIQAARKRVTTDCWESVSREYANIARKCQSNPKINTARLFDEISQKNLESKQEQELLIIQREKLEHELLTMQREKLEHELLTLQQEKISAELQSVYDSWSWRLTAPLRKGKLILNSIIELAVKALRLMVGRILRFPLRFYLLRRISRQLFRMLGRYGWIRRLAMRILAGFPDVRIRLLQLISTDPYRRKIRRVPTLAKKGIDDQLEFKISTGIPSIQGISSFTAAGMKTVYYWVDYTVTEPTNTGMQRVTRCLARGLVEAGKDIVFVCWNENKKVLVKATRYDLEYLSCYGGPGFTHDILSLYSNDPASIVILHEEVSPEELTDAWLIIPEVTYITSHNLPPTLDVINYAKTYGMKTAFIFYDAIPLKLNDYADIAGSHADYMQHIALADIIVPISEFSSNDLGSFYKDQLNFHKETMPTIKPVLLPGEFYDVPKATGYNTNRDELIILNIGTIEPRKNQITLLKAFQNLCDRFPDTPLRLVLCGNLDPRIEPILHEAMQRNQKIKYLGYVDDTQLVEYYKKCTFSMFPSIEEGFGLPIIESLWHGKPVICANFGSMMEVAKGGGCLTVDVRSVAEIENAMERMLFDQEFRNQLAAEAVSRPVRSWREYAAEILNNLADYDNPARSVERIYYWVDHTSIYHANSGIQRVTRGLARALQQTGVRLIPVKWENASMSFYSPNNEELLHLSKWNGPNPENFCNNTLTGVETQSWLLIPELTNYEGGPNLADVVQVAKKQGLNTAIIFFDALPYKLTQFYSDQTRTTHASYMKKLANFDCVFPISNTSSSELQTFLFREVHRLVNIEEKIIPVLLPGEFTERRRTTTYEETQSSKINILCVGTIEPRKNHLTLLESFNRVTRDGSMDTDLVLVGGCPFPELEQKIKEYIKQNNRIHWLPDVDDTILAQEYAQCHFTVYPSIEEGFGLPILESLWYAKPCICRNTGAMVEAAEGGGCLVVDTTSVDDLTRAINLLARDRELRTKLGKEAVTRRLKTWDEYAYEILYHLVRNTVR